MNKHYKTGLIIGRFQPFHKGHAYLFQKALEIADELVIGIGSIGVVDRDNPFDLKDRQKMLSIFLSKEKLRNRIQKIVSLYNNPDDSVWLKETLRKTGPIDVVIGNNEWVNGIFEGAHIPVVRIGHYKRDILEGTKIRQRIREHKSWEDRVPKYLVTEINEFIKKENRR